MNELVSLDIEIDIFVLCVEEPKESQEAEKEESVAAAEKGDAKEEPAEPVVEEAKAWLHQEVAMVANRLPQRTPYFGSLVILAFNIVCGKGLG